MNEKANYEVYFGDNIFGKSIVDGNVITLNYLTTNGPLANGVSKFTFNDSINGYNNFTITTVSVASGGAYAESVDSVRINAQNTVYAQNRAITETDYAALIGKFIPVESISVWGGETLAPPVYGKVFISIKQPGTTANLTDTQKQFVLSSIQNRSALGSIREIVDPEYIYLNIVSDVKYDPTKTTLGYSSLITNITNGLMSWSTTNLNKFNSDFEYSKLVTFIDSVDASFIANDTYISFSKTKPFIYNLNTSYAFNFYCSIKQSNSVEANITSTAFRTTDDVTKDVYLQDVNGILQTYYIANSQKIVLNPNIGTVDYANGLISILTTMVVGSSLNDLTVTVAPDNKNTINSRNNIITLNANDINVTMRAI